MIKFNESLKKYKYILSFDIAKFHTGWALVDIVEKKIPMFGIIECVDQEGIWADMYKKTSDVICSVKKYCKTTLSDFFVTKEKLPQQAGKFTTISSLQALAQAHAINSLACWDNRVNVYDQDGVFSVSVKAYYRKICGIQKPTKEDINKKICEDFNCPEVLGKYDITDAVGCTETLVRSKWDADIKKEIKEIKKMDKLYKTNKKHEENSVKINNLQKLMIEV